MMKLVLLDLEQEDVDLLLSSLFLNLQLKQSIPQDSATPELFKQSEQQLRSLMYRTIKLQGAILDASTKAAADELEDSLR